MLPTHFVPELADTDFAQEHESGVTWPIIMAVVLVLALLAVGAARHQRRAKNAEVLAQLRAHRAASVTSSPAFIGISRVEVNDACISTTAHDGVVDCSTYMDADAIGQRSTPMVQNSTYVTASSDGNAASMPSLALNGGRGVGHGPDHSATDEVHANAFAAGQSSATPLKPNSIYVSASLDGNTPNHPSIAQPHAGDDGRDADDAYAEVAILAEGEPSTYATIESAYATVDDPRHANAYAAVNDSGHAGIPGHGTVASDGRFNEDSFEPATIRNEDPDYLEVGDGWFMI